MRQLEFAFLLRQFSRCAHYFVVLLLVSELLWLPAHAHGLLCHTISYRHIHFTPVVPQPAENSPAGRVIFGCRCRLADSIVLSCF